jgi:hypothetical protein
MADYSGIDLQSLMTAPEGEMQSTEPAPMEFEGPDAEESPIAAPEEPAELKLKDVTLMDIVNFILGKYEMSDKLKKALEKLPDSATEKEAEMEELTSEVDGGGYGDMDLESMGESDVDQPVSVSGSI